MLLKWKDQLGDYCRWPVPSLPSTVVAQYRRCPDTVVAQTFCSYLNWSTVHTFFMEVSTVSPHMTPHLTAFGGVEPPHPNTHDYGKKTLIKFQFTQPVVIISGSLYSIHFYIDVPNKQSLLIPILENNKG